MTTSTSALSAYRAKLREALEQAIAVWSAA
jgi:hypothetical protein